MFMFFMFLLVVAYVLTYAFALFVMGVEWIERKLGG
jgi:hypothetical protein